jgi:hypothetical protein
VVREDGVSNWEERWSNERIEQRRRELGLTEFARQMLCKPRDDDSARFKREWVEAGLKKGLGLATLAQLDVLPTGCATFTGVDLGVQTKESADQTVLFTILVHPNEDRQVLCVEAGRWSGPDIVRRIIDTHRRYRSIVYVENNAAQDFVLQFAREHGAIPVRPFTTGRTKAHPEFGVESLAVEMQNAKWIIPNHEGHCDREVRAWLDELLAYSPFDHTGDRVMASWFAREGARAFAANRKGGVKLRVVG